MRLDASSFEPSCNIIQTGSLLKTNSNGTTFINHFNNYISTVYNTVGTQNKADPTNSNTVLDASIVVTPNLFSYIFTSPTTDCGTMTVTAQGVVLGNKTSTVSIPGTLVISYVHPANVTHQVSVYKWQTGGNAKNKCKLNRFYDTTIVYSKTVNNYSIHFSFYRT